MTMFNAIGKIFAKAPGFAVIRDRDHGRDAVTIERKSDDELRKGKRNLEIISSQREDFRNTTFSPATALQLQINVVGTVGGRVTVLGEDGKIDANATKAFRRWAKHAEFTRGMSLNDLLRLILTQLTHVGGDCIAVFDRGILAGDDTPSLRLKIFEPDQIKNIPQTEFNKLYPELAADGKPKYVQVNGFVKDYMDRIVGAFVGRSITADEFASGEYIALPRLEMPGDFSHSCWIHVANLDRPNQTRGISPLHHVQNQLTDIAAIQQSEVQAAKLNAGLGIILNEGTAPTDTEEQRTFEEALDGAMADGGAIEDPEEMARIIAAENEALKTASRRMHEGESAVIRLSGDKKIESFNNQRPNLNVVEFYDRMIDVNGTVLGLSQMYTRLKPQGSYSAARAEMCMVAPMFEMWKKQLERGLLDWLAVQVLDALGFNTNDLENRLVWSWPKMTAVDEGTNQTALQKKFLNCETNLIDIHGADREAFLDQRAVETEMFHARGLTAPWEVTVSGAQITEPTPAEDNGGKEEA